MFKFNIYNLFGVNEKKINSLIASLEEKKGNLNQIIDGVMEPLLKERFPNREFSDIVNAYGEKINDIKSSLYANYSNEIGLRISRLNLLKKEISK